MLTRCRLTLMGVVQGVGMRPHIATVARQVGVTGHCGNNDREVWVEIQGTQQQVTHCVTQILAQAPILAEVLSHRVEDLTPIPGESGFAILPSQHVPGEKTLIPRDVSICDDCIADMQDPTNRRYRYPFTTCTNCGPRLSIIEALPYDRPATTMKDFPLCPDCQREYTDPGDRRFHAQPISCPNCGPTLWLQEGGRKTTGEDLWRRCAQLLGQGKILAVKGIGGFHLMCDATNEQAVRRLRAKKHRPHKPLALMVPNVKAAQDLVLLSAEEKALLCSPARPIVTAMATDEGAQLLPWIAPGLSQLGVLLPYTPVHLLLVDRPLVATSGNQSGEPIAITNQQALALPVDAWLLHDWPIHIPVEDSVFLSTTLVRRSRGLAPTPVPLPAQAAKGPTVLAIGGEMKNSFCLAEGTYAHLSTHVGEMGSYRARQVLRRGIEQMLTLRDVRPEVVACDMHPGYTTSTLAEELAEDWDARLIEVQHHHAHAVALAAEHGKLGENLVVATLDGTGYGTDGTIWGGEILQLRRHGFDRLWHVPTFPLVGGDRAVTHPWRIALGVASAYGLDEETIAAQLSQRLGLNGDEVTLVASQLASGFGAVACSSAGRLFDAAAALLTLAPAALTYEGQAAMLLQAAGTRAQVRPTSAATSLKELCAELIDANPLSPEDRAYRFHEGCAGILATKLAATGADVVGLSGGCALNSLLVALLRQKLHTCGVDLLTHRAVPTTDGGLSLGQAIVARTIATENNHVQFS